MKTLAVISSLIGIAVGFVTIWSWYSDQDELIGVFNRSRYVIEPDTIGRIASLKIDSPELLRTVADRNGYQIELTDRQLAQVIQPINEYLEYNADWKQYGVLNKLVQHVEEVAIKNEGESTLKAVQLFTPYPDSIKAVIEKENKYEPRRFTRKLELGDLSPGETVKVYTFTILRAFSPQDTELRHSTGYGQLLFKYPIDRAMYGKYSVIVPGYALLLGVACAFLGVAYLWRRGHIVIKPQFRKSESSRDK